LLPPLILSACISSVFLVFPYGKHEFTHNENPNLLKAHSQENSCKLKASHSKQNNSCPAKTFMDADIHKIQEDSLKKIEALQKDKGFQEFQEHVLRKNEEILNSESFQAAVTELKQAQRKNDQNSIKASNLTTPGELYIFVSLSLREKALLNLAQDAKQFGATLVLRGFIDGSYAKTAKALQKIIQKTGQGFIIDPELFTLFAVRAVPTFILTKPFQLQAQERTQTPLHDRIMGHVSAHYALETFSQMGDLKFEAMALLQKKESR